MSRRSDPDRMAVAVLSGRAIYCVTHDLPQAEAIASLREISARPDLLAEVAGILLGCGSEAGGWSTTLAQARLVIQAGADRSLLMGWMREGRRRVRVNAGPFYEERDDLDDLLREALDGLEP